MMGESDEKLILRKPTGSRGALTFSMISFAPAASSLDANGYPLMFLAKRTRELMTVSVSFPIALYHAMIIDPPFHCFVPVFGSRRANEQRSRILPDEWRPEDPF